MRFSRFLEERRQEGRYLCFVLGGPFGHRADGARVDHEIEDEEIPGVVVSRINLSPRFMRELIDAMEDNYSKWRTREGIKNLPEFERPDEPPQSGL
jgi:hypothetical protein